MDPELFGNKLPNFFPIFPTDSSCLLHELNNHESIAQIFEIFTKIPLLFDHENT